MRGSAHDDTSVCGSPMLRLLGFESETPVIWRVKSPSPHLYHRKASSLGYWKATGDSACERLAHRKCSETWAIIVMTKMRFQRMVLKGSMHDCLIDILTKGSQASKIVLQAPEWDKFHSFAKEYNVSFYRRIIHFG